MESPRAPLVRLEGITRRFGRTRANERIDLTLRPGEIHALVGENGAGKSTLMRVLYGLLRPDAGRVLVDGREEAIASPADALRLGIGMIHQHFMLVPPMTVLENVALGYPGLRGLRPLPRAPLAARLRELCATYGLELDVQARVADLGVGERQRVEIARLLFQGARLLICDEPTAVLAPPEVAAFFRTLRRFRAEGRGVVLITHKLAEVLETADRVTVLRRGRVAGEAARDDFDERRLVAWIMGAGAGSGAAPAEARGLPAAAQGPSTAREEVLGARGLRARGSGAGARLEGIDFSLRRGEILGIAGVQGNGQRELAEVVSGAAALEGGEIRIGGERVGPRRRMAARLRPALVPEDRVGEGLIPGFTLWENLLVARLSRPADRGGRWIGHRRARAWARPLLERFRVLPADPDLPVEALSGGNQQKLLCARALDRPGPLLVAAQPTRGIDLASTAFLHGLLREYRAAGGSVLLISADLDEILALADRVAVLYRGRLGPARPRAECDLETLGREMVGVGSAEREAGRAAGGDAPSPAGEES
ncbi:MAG: ABC transporter ATP-binding protein [Candidatus Eisenbacteria bacterium]|uniref:ABC transporter ATP-binding protein n=1 Tax=Eiseniibacteriota bacterium TaxID=2212470 RepID=A0A938BKR4_UNCEI|nr:ABC transporter ATP-binding protein [Candidatus Eisenbacteria bacterium]